MSKTTYLKKVLIFPVSYLQKKRIRIRPKHRIRSSENIVNKSDL